MNAKQMFLSFIPWLIFTAVVERRGANAAGIAAALAAGLSLLFLVKASGRGRSIKLIDATGVAVFGLMAVVGLAGGQSVDESVADFGRGGAALVLGAVMLGSVLVMPFTEQYARESVPRQYWDSPAFHAVNRRISAAWGCAVLAMGAGHLVAGAVDPSSDPAAGARPVDLLLNWVVPALLVLAAIAYTNRAAEAAGGAGAAGAVGAAGAGAAGAGAAGAGAAAGSQVGVQR